MNLPYILSTPDKPWSEHLAEPTTETPDLVVTGEVFQTVLGFGACFNELGWKALSRLTEADRTSVLTRLFSPSQGCGFEFCRLPIGANDFSDDWYSHAETDGDLSMAAHSIERDQRSLIPFVRAATAVSGRPPALFASPWSPPEWMKERQVYNGSVLQWTPEIRAAYALYLLKFVRAYRAEGIPILQLHVQNEPGSDQKFPSCLWTGERLAAFIRDDLGPLFEAENEPCEIWLGTLEKGIEHGYDPVTIGARNYARWVHPTLGDPACRRHVKGLGLQWDGKGLLPVLARCWPEVPLIQTESECGDGQNSWGHMLYTADLMWQFFQHGAVSYVYWNMALETGGLSTWGWHQNSLFTVDAENRRADATPEFHLMRHLGAVRAGARRVGLAGVWSPFSFAFWNADDSLVILLWNPTEQAKQVGLDVLGRRHAIPLAARSLASIKFTGFKAPSQLGG